MLGWLLLAAAYYSCFCCSSLLLPAVQSIHAHNCVVVLSPSRLLGVWCPLMAGCCRVLHLLG